jgi:hypothetical protein
MVKQVSVAVGDKTEIRFEPNRGIDGGSSSPVGLEPTTYGFKRTIGLSAVLACENPAQR